MGSSDQNSLLGPLIFTLVRQLCGDIVHIRYVSNHLNVISIQVSCFKLDPNPNPKKSLNGLRNVFF